MSYTINNNSFLWVKFQEDHKSDAIEDFIKEILANYSKDQSSKVIVDARGAEISDKLFSIRDTMANFEGLGVSKDTRIAVLRNSGSGKYHDFMKNVVSDKGYNFKLFIDFEEAVTWVNQK